MIDFPLLSELSFQVLFVWTELLALRS